MKRRVSIQELGGAHAIILHREHLTVRNLSRQLTAIGLQISTSWPVLDAGALGADFVFFDADMGHDEQFPWPAGQSPMPLIALIGSEAPGRIDWALSAGADAQLLKPIGDGGVYSALLIARAAHNARKALLDDVDSLRRRLNERQTVVRAVNFLMVSGVDEDAAYDRLRRMAMDWRINFEDAAQRVVAQHLEKGDLHDRHGHRG
ncbi:ANTAR domain-containing response regulator [Sulfitobacter sp. MF3-043]|uniref:ANTAR domain-containing response regulator n=1 Tax=Sulfitobacter sediminivivens TaxID=3252902 RepID=UPI0036DE5501